MGLNREQALKLRDRNLANDPDYYKKLAAKSPSVKNNFVKGGKLAQEMGRIGGKKSKRVKKETK